MGEWTKRPGLFYRHELEQVITVDGQYEYLFRLDAYDHRGRELIGVYWRRHDPSAKGSPDVEQSDTDPGAPVVAQASAGGGLA